MYTKLITLGVVLLPLVLYSQTVKNEMDHGSSKIEWRIYETEGPVAAFTVTSSQIWYSLGSTVGVYDRKTNQTRAYPNLGKVSSAGIKTIANDGRGSIWFGGSAGAVLYANGKFKSFTKDNGLSDNTVNVIFCASGSVWLGTEKGVSQYRGGSWNRYSAKDGLSGNSVRDICADKRGGIWFATNKGVALYRSGQWKVYTEKAGLSSNNVHAIAYDTQKKQLWVAVGEQDVNNYNGKKWDTFMDIQPDITCIMVDTQSRIWFGAMTGVLKYNGFEWVTDPAKVGFPAAVVNDMYRDGAGDLYFALDNGILHMTNPYPY